MGSSYGSGQYGDGTYGGVGSASTVDAVAKRITAQLEPFTDFLATNGVRGFVGEVGWPNEPHAGAIDAALWNAAAEQWATLADDAQLTIAYWSAWLLNVYELSIYGNESGGPTGDLETVHTQAEVVEAHPVQDGWPAGTLRGVNFAGPEFAHDPITNGFSNNNRGVPGTDYFYPNLTQFQNLKARNVQVVRLPFRWERIQPTLGAALDSAELTRLTDCVAAAGTAGLQVILDCHNYARYHYWTGTEIRTLKLRRAAGIDTTPDGNGEGRFGVEYLVDLWERLSAAFAANATVVAHDLQNEPHDLDAESGSFSGTTMYAFASTIQGWAAESAGTTASHDAVEGHAAAGALKIVRTDTAFTNVRFNDAGGKLNDPGAGNVLSTWVKIAAGSPAGTYTARNEWQTAGFAWQSNGVTTYFDTSGNQVAGLVIGSWVEVRTDFAGNPITSPNAYGLQVNCPSTTTLTLYVDDFARGSVSGALSAMQVWEDITQQVVDAIAATGDDTDLMVPGYGWNVLSWAHTTAWITPPAGYSGVIRYETHHYFDPDGSGNYGAGEDYAATHAAAVTAGYTDDADATPPVISNVAVSGITATGAQVTWTTDEAADSRVEYGLDSQAAGLYGRSTQRAAPLLTSHAVTLAGLTPGATYRYRVRSRDAAGNLAVSAASGTFTTSAADATPPVISAVNATDVMADRATITWTTDEPADSLVEFGLDTTYGNGPPLDQADVTAHSVALTGLTPGTTYHYRVSSRDAAGNLTTSGDFTLETLPGGLTSPAGLRMKRSLPVFYAASRGMDALLQAEGAEFDLVRAALAAVVDQWFIDTATWTLDRWERELGLPVADAQPLTERREKVRSRLRGTGTATIRVLKTVAASYEQGDIEVVEDHTAYRLLIRFVDTAGVPPNVTDLQAALRAVAPAHLSLDYEYRWSLWGFLDAADLTWGELDALNLTWGEFDVHFVGP